MTPDDQHADFGPATPRERAAAFLEGAAFVILLCVLAGRCFINEMPFLQSSLSAFTAVDPRCSVFSAGIETVGDESSRITCSMLLLGSGVLWLLAGAIRGRLALRHGWMAIVMLLFAGLSLISAMRASNSRIAADAWIEQVTLMTAAFVAAQLCSDRRRFSLLVIVLAGVGATLAVKGFYQVFEEAPRRIAALNAGAATQPADDAANPFVRLFESRQRDWSATGFFGLSNVFGSVMVVVFMASLGVAVDKLRQAIAARRAGIIKLKPGEIDVPLLAGSLSAIVALGVFAALLLSRSRGAIIAVVLAILVTIAVVIWRKHLQRRWKLYLLGLGAVMLLGVAAVVGYGLKYDRLPTKTMTFRWYYWTASARMVADNPTFGVGPGNFYSSYVQYRRPEAEEEVKLPHNFIVHAAAQYGLPGATLYLAIVGAIMIGACRPRQDDDFADEKIPPRIGAHLHVAAIAAVLATVFAVTFVFAGAAAGLDERVAVAFFPTAVLAIMLILACWAGWSLLAKPFRADVVCRIAIVAAMAGFLLHSMAEQSMGIPAAATVFWITAGAALGAAGYRATELIRPRYALAIAGAIGVVAAAVILAGPVYSKLSLVGQMNQRLAARDNPGAVACAEQAAWADRLDPTIAADAANITLASCPRVIGEASGECLLRSLYWARQASRRDRAYFANAMLAGRLQYLQAAPDAYVYTWDHQSSRRDEIVQVVTQALTRDPRNPAALSDMAWAFYIADRYPEAIAALREAVKSAPSSPTLQAHLAQASYKAGNLSEARQAWQSAATLAPRGALIDAALADMDRSVVLNPQDVRLRLTYASFLLDADKPRMAMDQIAAAVDLDSRLAPESVKRLTPDEMWSVNMFKARAAALTATSQPSTAASR